MLHIITLLSLRIKQCFLPSAIYKHTFHVLVWILIFAINASPSLDSIGFHI